MSNTNAETEAETFTLIDRDRQRAVGPLDGTEADMLCSLCEEYGQRYELIDDLDGSREVYDA